MADNSIAKLKRIQAEAQSFLDEKETAAHDQKERPRGRRFVHFWLHVGRNFLGNRCPARASALAYTTLLALVPILAVVVSVSAGLLKKEGQKPIDELLDKLVQNVAPQLNLVQKVTDEEEAAISRQMVVQRIKGYIDNVQSGTLGVTAVIALIFVAISLLSTIEATFNDIWGVARGRNWITRVVQYWAAITLGPIFIVTAFALAAGPHFETTQKWLELLHLKTFASTLLPFIVLSAAFTLFYRLMPNTKVRWPAALAGGIVGGSLWQLNNIFNVIYVSRVVSYSKIYGSLGIIPVFLIGLYFSWLILLLGAQVAYAYQNREAYLQAKQAERVNQRGREFIALRVMTAVAVQFQRGAKAPSRLDLASAIGVPSQLLCQVLAALVQSKLLVEVAGEETAYAPARPLSKITAHDILQALRAGPGHELETREEPIRGLVRREYEIIQQAEQQSAAALTLQALAQRAQEAEAPSERA